MLVLLSIGLTTSFTLFFDPFKISSNALTSNKACHFSWTGHIGVHWNVGGLYTALQLVEFVGITRYPHSSIEGLL